MQVTISSDWWTSGGRRGYAITLDESDLPKIEGMTKSQVRKELERRGEMLVIEYTARNGGMDVATANSRINELKKNA